MKNNKALNLKTKIVLGLGRVAHYVLKRMGYQASSTPGKWILALEKNILSILSKRTPILLVSGTNGKTSTVSFIVQFLKAQGFKVATNGSGANLKNGLTTTLALYDGKVDVFVLEVDEAALKACASELSCELLVLTNIFRDQLDRFGEMHQVFQLLKQGTEQLKPSYLLVNGDDPLLSHLDFPFLTLGEKRQEEHPLVCLSNKEHESFLSSMLCPSCSNLLNYHKQTIDHLGNFYCEACHYQAPTLDYAFDESRMPISQNLRLEKGSLEKMLETGQAYESVSSLCHLEGTYNAYNIVAAVAATDIFCQRIAPSLREKFPQFPSYTYESQVFSTTTKKMAELKSSFGRMERIPLEDGKSLCFLLVKNPAGYSQTLNILSKQQDIGAMIWGLNDKAPDGRDVSWIWDIPFENYSFPHTVPLHYVLGDRKLDLHLRLNYAYEGFSPVENETLIHFIQSAPQGKTIYLVCNYTAMLETRALLSKHFNFSSFWEKEGEKS